MKNIFKKIILLVFVLVLLIAPTASYAVSFDIVTKSSVYKDGSEFYADVLIDPQGQPINGIDGELLITNANVLRIEDGGSVVKNWISRPEVVERKGLKSIVFSGITPNGFNGYLNSNQKKGLVFRVVLKNKNNDSVNLSLKNILVTKNDGQGTSINTGSKILNIGISSTGDIEKYTLLDNEKPEVSYEIVTDQNLFDGKKTLVFSVADSKSGFKHAYVKEGMNDFKLVNSPYVLEDQSLRGIILIKVVDNADNETLVTIRPSLAAYLPINIIGLLVLIILVFIVAVFYIKNKNNKRNAKSK
jgi:hypothetical protein